MGPWIRAHSTIGSCQRNGIAAAVAARGTRGGCSDAARRVLHDTSPRKRQQSLQHSPHHDQVVLVVQRRAVRINPRGLHEVRRHAHDLDVVGLERAVSCCVDVPGCARGAMLQLRAVNDCAGEQDAAARLREAHANETVVEDDGIHLQVKEGRGDGRQC